MNVFLGVLVMVTSLCTTVQRRRTVSQADSGETPHTSKINLSYRTLTLQNSQWLIVIMTDIEKYACALIL